MMLIPHYQRIFNLLLKLSSKESRISWDDYGILLAICASFRSEDPNTKVGCCTLRHDNSIASMGYNGAPPGINIDWTNREEKLKRIIHSEANALRYCKPGEIKTIFITHSPCINCLSLIASYNIKRIVYIEEYHRDDMSIKIAGELSIELIKYG